MDENFEDYVDAVFEVLRKIIDSDPILSFAFNYTQNHGISPDYAACRHFGLDQEPLNQSQKKNGGNMEILLKSEIIAAMRSFAESLSNREKQKLPSIKARLGKSLRLCHSHRSGSGSGNPFSRKQIRGNESNHG